MKKKFKKFAIPVIFGIFLAAFTLYVLLDTFVLTRVYKVVVNTQSSVFASSEETDSASDEASSEENGSASDEASSVETGSASDEASSGTADLPLPEIQETEEDDADTTDSENTESEDTASETEIISTDSEYSDGNISITISQYREYDTDIYVADIQLSDASYLETALAQNAYGKNVTAKTSEIAEENNAILAINGDYYGSQESGYVLRDGALYRDTAKSGQEDLVIYEDGSFAIINESDVSAQSLLENGAQQILSFGPGLVENGSITVTQDEEVGKAKASNPRTAIAQIDELHYLFIVSDGRTSQSAGLSLYELAEFAQSLGAPTVYNLDGGGSSTMYFNGKVINNPTADGNSIKERRVSDIVYIGY